MRANCCLLALSLGHLALGTVGFLSSYEEGKPRLIEPTGSTVLRATVVPCLDRPAAAAGADPTLLGSSRAKTWEALRGLLHPFKNAQLTILVVGRDAEKADLWARLAILPPFPTPPLS